MSLPSLLGITVSLCVPLTPRQDLANLSMTGTRSERLRHSLGLLFPLHHTCRKTRFSRDESGNYFTITIHPASAKDYSIHDLVQLEYQLENSFDGGGLFELENKLSCQMMA